jgi:hypothetical protein
VFALFECQLEHIGRYDRVKVECACGREVLMLPLDAFNGLPNNTRIIDLLRCNHCGEKGHVDLGRVGRCGAARVMCGQSRCGACLSHLMVDRDDRSR